MMQINRVRKVAVVAAVLVLLVASPGTAGDDSGEQTREQAATTTRQRNWRMRLHVAVVGDGGVMVSSGWDHGHGISTQGGGGVGINFEYRYSPRMGFEMGAMALASNIGVHAGKTHVRDWGSVGLESFVPLTFGLNFHPLKKTDVFDFYVGPLLTSTFYSNIGVGSEWNGWAGVRSGVNIGAGVSMGADLNLGHSRWSLNGGIKYIAFSGSTSGIELDPLMVTFGFGFRF